MKKASHYYKSYQRLPAALKKLLWWAAWWSLITEFDLHLNKFRNFKKYQHNTTTESTDLTPEQKQQVLWMRKVMRILEHRAPWTPMCLNRAVTAKRLLQQQGIETTIHIGFKPRERPDKEFEGHAWLTLQGFFISGLIPQLPKYRKLRPIAQMSDTLKV